MKEEKFPDGYRHLFSTLVGSHVWRMNHAESDIDLFVCYVAPSTDFLIGKTHNKSHSSNIDGVDRSSSEIGKVVNQLLKNNINYLIYVLSPRVEFTTPEHKRLVDLTHMNLHKGCLGSINGLAYGMYRRYIEENKGDTQKVRRTILRTLNFGTALLKEGVVEFTQVLHDVEIPELDEAFETLDLAYENSVLPEEPLHKDKMIDWLLSVRMQNLRENV